MTHTPGVLHPSWHRVVLKLSGGLFAGSEPLGISPDVVAHLATEIIAAVKEGVQVAAVVGGGNMFRGAALAERGIDRARAGRSGTWKRAGWSSSGPGSARRTSPPTPPPRSGPWRSAPTPCSRAPR